MQLIELLEQSQNNGNFFNSQHRNGMQSIYKKMTQAKKDLQDFKLQTYIHKESIKTVIMPCYLTLCRKLHQITNFRYP
jgi:hypothetical protein